MFRTPINTPSSPGRRVIVAGLLVASTAALAQELSSGLSLRSTLNSGVSTAQVLPGATPPSAGSSVGTGASTGTGPASSTLALPSTASNAPSPNRRLQRPASRRGRPTLATVRAPVRLPPGGTTVTDVQPQLNGVPDPLIVTAPTVPARRRTPEDDPYASLGIRLGGLTVFPSIGENLGYDSNPNRTSVSRGSFVAQTEGELRVQSDWSRHELTGFLRGAYNEYTAVPAASRPEGAGRLNLRLDATRDTQVNLEARYLIDTQRPDSPELNTTVRTRPVVYNEGASVGVTQRFNRLLATLQGTIDRADYEDAQSSAGTIISQRDRNLTQFGARLRFGYELTPGLIPFIEGLADTRVYDQRVDFSGFARSSDGFGARVGTTFEITRLLTGEIAAGAINRRYDDRRLGDLTSPLVDASLNYALTPLTTIRASAQALVDETTIPNATGVRTVRGTLELIHALRRNLTVTAGLTASNYDYQGIRLNEEGFGASLRAEYKLTRSVAVRASYLFERLHSSLPSSDYSTNVFLLGMRYAP